MIKKSSKRTRGKRKKKSWKFILFFLICEFIFIGAAGLFIVLYGPFENCKKAYVSAAMKTMKHQWLATTFLSDDKINKIINTNAASTNYDSNDSEVKIPKKQDDTIERFDFNNFKMNGYLLVIKDPKRVKVGYSSKLGEEGETTSKIAENFDAVAAINGGAFVDKSSTLNWTGNGGIPTGIIMSEGKVIFNDTTESKKSELMAIKEDGTLLVGDYSLNDLKALNVKEAVSFGPVLIKDGKATQLKGGDAYSPNQRTAIAQRGSDGAILLIVIDGRSIIDGAGATAVELQEILLKYGATNAINLDGGKSSTMYINGKIINHLSDGLGERSIASAIVVK